MDAVVDAVVRRSLQLVLTVVLFCLQGTCEVVVVKNSKMDRWTANFSSKQFLF